MKTNTDLAERSYKFSLRIIKLLCNSTQNQIPEGLKDQLLRSGTSIGANIAEVKSASSRKDFSNFYSIALKSANETHYWLRLINDCHFNDSYIDDLILETLELSKILASCVLKLKKA